MALDADEIVIGSFGRVWVADVGTAGPVDTTAALGAGWSDLGYISEDGVSTTPGMDLTETPVWQSAYPARRSVNSRTLDIGFTMMQWNETTLPFALGGGSVTSATDVHTYTPPTSGEVDERAMVIEWQDGAKNYRMHILRGMVSDLGGFALSRGAAAGLDVTYTMLAEADIAPFVIITDDAAFAAA